MPSWEVTYSTKHTTVDNMKTPISILAVLTLLIIPLSVTATVGGGWGGPHHPWCDYCHIEDELGWYWQGNNPHLGNVSPAPYSDDVDITDKGVNTCVNLTLPDNCTANLTYEWLNWSQYFDAWFDWVDAQDWDDWINISWATEPTWENDSFWYEYANWSGVNASQQLCEYNENVSCHTEGDWTTAWFDWRATINITCANYTYNATCYYCFQPELCPVNYIHPPSPNGTACPCCDYMCIGVDNDLGHNMNISIYRNDTQFEDFYFINNFINVPNGTYCFCIDGHINNSTYYPMLYNAVYHWYVNVTDTETNESTISSAFQFRTPTDPEDCPCGEDAIIAIAEAVDTDTIQDDIWVMGVPLIIVFPLIYYYWKKKR